MTAAQGMDERSLIPRWRPFRLSAALGELSSGPRRAPRGSIRQLDLEPLSAFSAAPTLHTAADALSLALSLADPEPLRPIVEFVEAGAGDNALLAASAARVRQQLDCIPVRVEDSWFDVHERNAELRNIRRELQQRPRNPTKWVDLALAQTLLGQTDRAKRSLTTALGLAPLNRFVLRSAVRFFIHAEDPGAAQHALRGAKGSADPWILAAEIASDEAAGTTPTSMKDALFVLASGNFGPWELSELACTVAHSEFNEGRDKRARKFLEQATPEPTENAAAQIVFESNRGGFTAKPVQEPQRRFEAEAREARWRRDWAAAVESGKKWLQDQPFAVEPATFLSYVASVGGERYDVAEQAARTGLLANPLDATLANNLAFSLANQDKAEEAADILAKRPAAHDDQDAAVYTATQGLVAFRRGQWDAGRQQYQLAVRECGNLNLPHQAALAASFWAREEVRVNSPVAHEVIGIAKRLAELVPNSDATLILSRLY